MVRKDIGETRLPVNTRSSTKAFTLSIYASRHSGRHHNAGHTNQPSNEAARKLCDVDTSQTAGCENSFARHSIWGQFCKRQQCDPVFPSRVDSTPPAFQ